MSDNVICPTGQVLVEKYRVERVLGQGGMGVVLEATHLHLGQRVALKLIAPNASQSPELGARFLREAQAAARLKSEHVARVLDAGTLECGSPFLAMELLDGEDLAAILARQGTLPVRVAAAWLLEACEAVAEAHAVGIIHRDLKPANLFLARGAGEYESVKVLDFGIAKLATPPQAQRDLTATSSVLGSPSYASPEQLRASKTVDHRTDLWSLGVTLYQLVSGVIPWTAEGLPDLLLKIATEPPAPLASALRVPPTFEAILRRCLEKDPADRFPSVAALAGALAPFTPDGRAAAERVRRAGRCSTQPRGFLHGSGPGASQRARRWPAYCALGLLPLAGVLAGAASASLRRGPPPAAVTPLPPPAHDAPPRLEPLAAAVPTVGGAGGRLSQDPRFRELVEALVPAAPAESRPPAARPGDDRRYRELVSEARQLGRGSCAAAVPVYERAIDHNPAGADARTGLGDCLLELGDYDRAIGHFRAALAVSRRNVEASWGAARAYELKGNTGAASSHYRRYLELAPRGEKAALARERLDVLVAPGPGEDQELFGRGAAGGR